MEATPAPTIRSVLPASLMMALTGWLGIAALVFLTLPTIGPRWLFFFMLVLALTGSVLPLAAFLNLRFPTTPPAPAGVILREALWVGIYFATLAWLQIGRVLTGPLALVILVGLILMEWLLRLREKSQWTP